MVENREESMTLALLTAIEDRSDVTQRHLATRLGVALGLANSYLARCVHKGLVKITQAPANTSQPHSIFIVARTPLWHGLSMTVRHVARSG